MCTYLLPIHTLRREGRIDVVHLHKWYACQNIRIQISCHKAFKVEFMSVAGEVRSCFTQNCKRRWTIFFISRLGAFGNFSIQFGCSRHSHYVSRGTAVKCGSNRNAAIKSIHIRWLSDLDATGGTLFLVQSPKSSTFWIPEIARALVINWRFCNGKKGHFLTK